MAGPDLATLIARAIATTFRERGLVVQVYAQQDYDKDQLRILVIHQDRREYLAIDALALREWGCDRSKPLRFTNGVELYLVSMPREHSHAQRLPNAQANKRIAAI